MNAVHRVFLVLILTISFQGIQAQTKVEGLPNFHQVNNHLYRSAQPKPEAFQRLAQMGIKSVINLRNDDDKALVERQQALAAGLLYFNVPLKTLGQPTDQQIAQVLALIAAPENQPALVHCAHGSDRTGTVIAVYRIEIDGWTAKQALQEAKGFGLGFWQRGMKHYIENYYKRHLKQPAATVLISRPRRIAAFS